MPKTVLHKPVTYPCACCGVPQTFTFTNANDLAICGGCKRHTFRATVPKAQADQHRQMWVAKFDETTTSLKAEIARLTETVARQRTTIKDYETRLDAKFEDLPPEEVERYYVNDLVVAALAERDTAWYARDKAMRALTAIEAVHNPVLSKGQCSCGEPLDSCKVGRVLESQQPRLFQWQKKQRELGNLRDDELND